MADHGNAELRAQLVGRLRGRGAHMPLEAAVDGFPLDRINDRYPNGPYGAWGVIEHMRRAQRDILDYIRGENYHELEWPKDFWPAEGEVASPQDWWDTLAGFQADLESLVAIVEDTNTDLYADVPPGNGHTVLREVLLVCDHNAYHIGELAIMRQVMGTW